MNDWSDINIFFMLNVLHITVIVYFSTMFKQNKFDSFIAILILLLKCCLYFAIIFLNCTAHIYSSIIFSS